MRLFKAAFTAVFLVWATVSGFGQIPVLTVERVSGSQLRLQWRGPAGDFVLEQTEQLQSGTSWRPVAAAPVASEGTLQVQLPAGAAVEFYRLRKAPAAALTSVTRVSPGAFETGVSVLRETIVEFSAPLRADTVLSPGLFYAEAAGRRLLTRLELSPNRQVATLFYLEPVPSSSRVRVRLQGDSLRDVAGRTVDVDGDGLGGGVREWTFDTMSTAAIPGTAITGYVYDSQAVSLPGGVTTNRPIHGALVTVDGTEQSLRAETDESGFFRLSPCPAGRFFVHIDGRPAVGSTWPAGAYYAVVGKTFETVAGRTNNLANGTGKIYLPLIPADALRPVSLSQPTTINFPASLLAQNPALAGVSLTVPANSLFSDDGQRGGRVGMAPVPPDRLPSPLPSGLNAPLVITIQTDGAGNFAEPVAVTFPNLPDPVTGVTLPPGAKSALWSFNHDTGRWEMQGGMTVSADGKFLVSDPGSGVRQPGWHTGFAGSTGGGGGGGGGPCAAEQQAMEDALFGCAWGIGLGLLELAPAIGCGASLGSAAASISQACGDPTQNCGGSAAYSLFFGAAGCVPGPLGTAIGLGQCIFELGSALGDLTACQLQNQPPNSTGLSVGGRARLAADDSPLGLQMELANRLQELQLTLLGDGRWLTAAAMDPSRMKAFAEALVAALDPASDGAERISAAEQNSLLALPAPGNLDEATRRALILRFDRFADHQMTANERTAIASAGNLLNSTSTRLQGMGWQTMLDGFLTTLPETYRAIDAGFSGSAAPARVGAQPAAGAPGVQALRQRVLYYQLIDATDGAVRRGQTLSDGTFGEFPVGVALTADRQYLLNYLDPVTLEQGSTYFTAGSAGSRFRMPRAWLTLVPGADSDGDGLTDQLEGILGSDPAKSDTDGDGMNDLAQLQQGRSPLAGFGPPAGVVARVPLSGQALGLQVVGNVGYVATGNFGLATVDLTNPLAPVLLGQLNLPGESKDVAIVPSVSIAALTALPDNFIPTEPGFLHFVDIADPAQPRLVRSLVIPALAVDSADGLFYVAMERQIRIYEPVSGLEAGWFSTADTVSGLRVTGGRAYVTLNSALEIYDVTVRPAVRLGRLAGSFGTELLGRVQMELDGTTLFIAKAQGMVTVNVANPASPVLLGQQPTARPATRSLALDGGGNAVVLGLGTPAGNFIASGFLSVYDVTDPTRLERFRFSILPARRGFELVGVGESMVSADGLDGLTVINHLGPEINGVPPVLSLDLTASDQDPVQGGIQFPEGGLLRIRPRIVDDWQVVLTELLVNGSVVDRRRSYPAGFDFLVPGRRQIGGFNSNLVVQVSATDRAGNRALSSATTIQLIPDQQPPTVVQTIPTAGGLLSVASPLLVEFNEPLDPGSFSPAGIILRSAGPDQVEGTADDVNEPVIFQIDGPRLVLTPTRPISAGRYSLSLPAGSVGDVAGNRAGAFALSFTAIGAGPGTAWFNTNVASRFNEARNWWPQRVPNREHVWIESPGAAPLITVDSFLILQSLTSRSPMVFTERSGVNVFGSWNASERIEATEANLRLESSNHFARELIVHGGNLTTFGLLDAAGGLVLDQGAQLTLSGPAASLRVSGGFSNLNATVRASEGATVGLLLAPQFDAPGDFTALFPIGSGFIASESRLRLDGVVAAAGPVDWNVRGAPSLALSAEGAGRLELPVLNRLTGRTWVKADGPGSVVDAPGLQNISGSDVDFMSRLEVRNGGEIRAAALTLSSNVTFLGSGVLTGSLVSGGRVAPDEAGAPLRISGNLELTAAGSLAPTLGLGLDRAFAGRVEVSGSVVLGGRLDLVLGRGYTPVAGQEFEVLTSGGVLTGAFSSVGDAGLGATLKAEVNVSGNTVRVRIVAR